MPTVNEKYLDSLIQRTVNLERYTESMKEDVLSLLNEVEESIVRDIASIDPTAPNLTKWKKERLIKLNKKVSATLDEGYTKAARLSKSGLGELAKQEAAVVSSSINSIVGAELFDVTLDAGQLSSLVDNTMIDGRLMGDWWKGQADSFKNKFQGAMEQATQQIQLGTVRGEGVGELIRRVRGSTELPGMMKNVKRESEALVRTSVMTVANESRTKMYKANKDVTKGFEVVATLDNATTPICRALDGKQWDWDYNPIGHSMPYPLGPPFHWNCRSTTVPVLKSWAELAGPKSKLSKKKLRKLDKVDNSVRASMVGGRGKPISGRATYNDWLKQQSVATQEDVLGIRRRAIWKEKDLSMKDLVNQRGRALTLEELGVRFELDVDSALDMADYLGVDAAVAGKGALEKYRIWEYWTEHPDIDPDDLLAWAKREGITRMTPADSKKWVKNWPKGLSLPRGATKGLPPVPKVKPVVPKTPTPRPKPKPAPPRPAPKPSPPPVTTGDIKVWEEFSKVATSKRDKIYLNYYFYKYVSGTEDWMEKAIAKSLTVTEKVTPATMKKYFRRWESGDMAIPAKAKKLGLLPKGVPKAAPAPKYGLPGQQLAVPTPVRYTAEGRKIRKRIEWDVDNLEDGFKELDMGVDGVVFPSLGPTLKRKIGSMGQEMEDVFARFPMLADKMDDTQLLRLAFENVEDLDPFAPGRVVGEYTSVLKKMRLALKNRILSHELTLGKHNVGVDLHTVFRHEMGHHFHREIISIFDRQEWHDIFKIHSKKYWRENVSVYGSKIDSELFAECFAAFTSPKYKMGMLPRNVENFFEKVIGKPGVATKESIKKAKEITAVIRKDLLDSRNMKATNRFFGSRQEAHAWEKTLKGSFAESKLYIRAKGSALKGIIDDGRFKSQIETGGSGGAYSPEMRRKIEKVLFGLPEDLPDSKRAIYGYMDGTGDPFSYSYAEQYGKFVLEMKDDVKYKTTWTPADSLRDNYDGTAMYTPSAVMDPKVGTVVTFQEGEVVYDSSAKYLTEFKNAFQRNGVSGKNINASELGTSYIEAQVHGGLKASSIKRIIINTHEDFSDLPQSVVRWAEQNNVPIVLYDTDTKLEKLFVDRFARRSDGLVDRMVMKRKLKSSIPKEERVAWETFTTEATSKKDQLYSMWYRAKFLDKDPKYMAKVAKEFSDMADVAENWPKRVMRKWEDGILPVPKKATKAGLVPNTKSAIPKPKPTAKPKPVVKPKPAKIISKPKPVAIPKEAVKLSSTDAQKYVAYKKEMAKKVKGVKSPKAAAKLLKEEMGDRFEVLESWVNGGGEGGEYYKQVHALSLRYVASLVEGKNAKMWWPEGWDDVASIASIKKNYKKYVTKDDYLKMRAFNQAYLDEIGYKGGTLYRGVGQEFGFDLADEMVKNVGKKGAKKTSMTFDDGGFSSYTSKKSIGELFGVEKGGLTYRIDVPKEDIFMHTHLLPKYASGDELEFILYGGKRKVKFTDIRIVDDDLKPLGWGKVPGKKVETPFETGVTKDALIVKYKEIEDKLQKIIIPDDGYVDAYDYTSKLRSQLSSYKGVVNLEDGKVFFKEMVASLKKKKVLSAATMKKIESLEGVFDAAKKKVAETASVKDIGSWKGVSKERFELFYIDDMKSDIKTWNLENWEKGFVEVVGGKKYVIPKGKLEGSWVDVAAKKGKVRKMSLARFRGLEESMEEIKEAADDAAYDASLKAKKKVDKPVIIKKKPVVAKKPLKWEEASVEKTFKKLGVEHLTLSSSTKSAKKQAVLIGEEFEKVLSSFPKLAKEMDDYKIPTVVFKDDTVLHGTTIGEYSAGTGKLRIATQLPKTHELKLGKNTVGGDVHTTFRHEVGHHVHRSYYTRWDSIYEAPTNPKRYWTKAVSKYAASNDMECFAECFAAYTSPKYKMGMLPKNVEDFMKEVVGKSKKAGKVDKATMSVVDRGVIEEVKVKTPEFKSVKKAEVWIKKKYPNIKEVNFKSPDPFSSATLDAKLLNPAIKQFEKLAEKYPDAAKRIKYFGVEKNVGAYQSKWASITHNGERFNLNKVWENADDLKRELKQSEITGFHPKGCNTVESLVTHEWGHINHQWLLSLKNRYVSPVKPGIGGGDHLVERTIESITKNFVKSMEDAQWKEGINWISEYARENQDECFAELFTAAFHGDKDVRGRKDVKAVRAFCEFFNKNEIYIDWKRVTEREAKKSVLNKRDKLIEKFKKQIWDGELRWAE